MGESRSSERTRLSLRKRIAFAATATVLVLVVLELAARLVAPAGPAVLLRSPLDGSGQETITDVFVPHAERFWALRPSLDLSPPVYNADVTDALGLRNRVTPGPKGDRTRVLCLGDSCTYGLGVSIDDAWPAQLARTADVDAINAGVTGYSTYQGALLLSELAPHLAPDVVVLSFGTNDARPWGTQQDGGWFCLTDAERAKHLRVGRWMQRSALVRLLLAPGSVPEPERMADGDAVVWESAGRARVPVPEFEAHVREIVSAAPRAVVLVWPRRAQIDGAYTPQMRVLRYPDYLDALRRVGREVGAQVIDVGRVFLDSGQPPAALYLDDVHASPEGCRLVARAVADALRP